VFGHDKKLEEHGTRAPAEVVTAEQSVAGVTAGNPAFAGATEVVWKLDVKVKPEGAEPFDANVEARLPQYTVLRAGTTVPVLFDPDDHSKVTLDMSPEGWARASAAQVGALTGNTALAAPIQEMMEAALKDPAGFQKHAMEQAEEAFKAAGSTCRRWPPGPRQPVAPPRWSTRWRSSPTSVTGAFSATRSSRSRSSGSSTNRKSRKPPLS
jgi:hypothetical protein